MDNDNRINPKLEKLMKFYDKFITELENSIEYFNSSNSDTDVLGYLEEALDNKEKLEICLFNANNPDNVTLFDENDEEDEEIEDDFYKDNEDEYD